MCRASSFTTHPGPVAAEVRARVSFALNASVWLWHGGCLRLGHAVAYAVLLLAHAPSSSCCVCQACAFWGYVIAAAVRRGAVTHMPHTLSAFVSLARLGGRSDTDRSCLVVQRSIEQRWMEHP